MTQNQKLQVGRSLEDRSVSAGIAAEMRCHDLRIMRNQDVSEAGAPLLGGLRGGRRETKDSRPLMILKASLVCDFDF